MKWNPWPVTITVLCVTAFLAAATVVMVMVRQRVELVTPDYYAQDRAHQQRIDQERRALALDPPVTFAKEPGSFVITFPDASATGTVTLYRPSDLTLDRTADLALDENGRQVIATSGLANGLWRVRVFWSQQDESYYLEKAVSLP